MKRKIDNKASAGIIAVIILVIAIVVACFVVWFQQANDRYIITGTVTQKWIDVGEDESFYLLRVERPDGSIKMLEVKRNILHGSNYNPDLVYSGISVNSTYKFTCWGWDWQWAWVYWYPNVIIAEEITS